MIFTTGVLQTTNFKPQVGAPLDNRTVVNARNDLISASMWQINGSGTTVDLRYTGMIVAVQTGVQGLYWLDSLANKDKLWATQSSNDKKGWRRMILEGDSENKYNIKTKGDIINVNGGDILLTENDTIISNIRIDADETLIIKEQSGNRFTFSQNPDYMFNITDVTTKMFLGPPLTKGIQPEDPGYTNLELAREWIDIETIIHHTYESIGSNFRLIAGEGIKLNGYNSASNVPYITVSNTNVDYKLPPASASTLGGVIIGAGLSVNSSGLIQTPIATTSTRGAIIIGKGLSIDTNGKLNVIDSASNNTLTLGTVSISSSGTSRNSNHPIHIRNKNEILSTINIKSGRYINLSQSGNTITINYNPDWTEDGSVITRKDIIPKLMLKDCTSQNTIITITDENTNEILSGMLFEVGDGLLIDYEAKDNTYTDIHGDFLPSLKIELVDEDAIYHNMRADTQLGINISPNGKFLIKDGSTKRFAITADKGYTIGNLIINDVVDNSLFGKTKGFYYVRDIKQDRSIIVESILTYHTITVVSNANGVISPNTNQIIIAGDNSYFVFSANAGYHISSVLIDGVNNQNAIDNGNYTFTNVQQNHIIDVKFSVNQFTINASSGNNGTISPIGNTVVNQGVNQVFSISPNVGYEIDQVYVDGVNNPTAVNSGRYTFTNVQQNHIISATFKIKTYTITPLSGENGSISPNTIQTINHGLGSGFSINANDGYKINSIYIDDKHLNLPNLSQSYIYTFINVTQNHIINVDFITTEELP
jgi:hypothetical protein